MISLAYSLAVATESTVNAVVAAAAPLAQG
jgi:hypothetical protein